MRLPWQGTLGRLGIKLAFHEFKNSPRTDDADQLSVAIQYRDVPVSRRGNCRQRGAGRIALVYDQRIGSHEFPDRPIGQTSELLRHSLQYIPLGKDPSLSAFLLCVPRLAS